MMLPKLEFWFSIGSTYTYLSVMRASAVAADHGVALMWRPFSVRAIMIEQNNAPFRDKPVKAAHMWRDIERRAARHGLAVRVPAPYPVSRWDVVNRVAVLAARDGWCELLATELYRRWFQHGEDPGLDPTLPHALSAIGQDPGRVLEAAASGEIEAAYLGATDTARALGVFGSPSFVVDGEVFWGDDRLEDAVDWARRGASGP